MPFYQWDRTISRLLPEHDARSLILTGEQGETGLLPAGDLEDMLPEFPATPPLTDQAGGSSLLGKAPARNNQ